MTERVKKKKRKVNSDLRRFKKDSERPDGRGRGAKKCDMLLVICLTYIDLNQIFLGGVPADLWFLKGLSRGIKPSDRAYMQGGCSQLFDPPPRSRLFSLARSVGA